LIRKLNTLLVAMMATLIVTLTSKAGLAEGGVASVYSSHEGTKTASGVKLDDQALTAAHRSLPFGSKVRVTNAKNGQSVVVTITDRGPFVAGRVIDVTPAAARALGFNGLAPVNLEVAERGNQDAIKVAKQGRIKLAKWRDRNAKRHVKLARNVTNCRRHSSCLSRTKISRLSPHKRGDGHHAQGFAPNIENRISASLAVILPASLRQT